ncbi:CDP-diacylglycerol--serine O-phosphatidyltransferase, partial [Klebsiella pneumoniae]|nr:CDP-diacylglycerol--serine O-phosphatidyltransferase [Klebsiella pneumoniae]
MLSKFKSAKHQQHLAQLLKLAQSADDVETLFHTRDFKGRLLAEIAGAKKTVYISALYIEHDDAGRDFLDALYAAKKANPELDIKVFVDWHRAQRGRIGAEANAT